MSTGLARAPEEHGRDAAGDPAPHPLVAVKPFGSVAHQQMNRRHQLRTARPCVSVSVFNVAMAAMSAAWAVPRVVASAFVANLAAIADLVVASACARYFPARAEFSVSVADLANLVLISSLVYTSARSENFCYVNQRSVAASAVFKKIASISAKVK